VGLSCALLAGLLNVGVATLQCPEMHAEDPGALLAFAATSALLAGLAQALAWALLLRRVRRRALEPAPLALALGTGVLALWVVVPLETSLHALERAERTLVLALLLASAAVVPMLAYRAASEASEGLSARGRVWALAAPPLGALALAVVWWQTYRPEDPAGPARLAALAGCAAAAIAAAVWASRRDLSLPWLIALAAALAGAALVSLAPRDAPGAGAAAAGAPSILLLTVDTLRPDALDLAENGSRTPALAALARDSLVFEQARSAGPWTKAGIASLLTGLSPLVHGVTERESRLPDEIQTLAERLRARGYRTGAVGRNPFLQPNANFHQGFEQYHMFPRSPGSSFGGMLLSWLSPVRFGHADPSSQDLTGMALDWIEAQRGAPFFFWLHYFDPHLPYAPALSYRPEGEAPARIGYDFRQLSAVRGGHLVPDAEERRWIRALYDAEVRDVDANIGRLLDALRASDLYGPMLVVFTSDHAEEFWEHDGFEHGHSVYDEVLRVPLFLKLPDSGETGSIGTRVTTASVTPTLLQRLGLDATGPFSVGPLAGPGSQAPDPASPVSTGMLYHENRLALVFDDFKYIRADGGAEALFDLAADPRERHSLVRTAPARLDEARRRLQARLDEAQALRRRLALPDESRFEPEPAWIEGLRELGYVE
jgi:arylsulfatase A-like enzyme